MFSPTKTSYPDATGELTISVMEIDYTLWTIDDTDWPVVHIFGRTEDGEREHIRAHGFQPYFYAKREHVLDIVDEDCVMEVAGASEDGGYETIRKEDVVKVTTRTPGDVSDVRPDEHYEADIPFPNRFFVDKGIESGVRVPEQRGDDGVIDVHHTDVEPVECYVDPRVLTYDIEVDDRGGFPEDGEEEILSIAAHDSGNPGGPMYTFFLNEPDDPSFEGSYAEELDLKVDDESSFEFRTFESEEAMLDEFLRYVDAVGADVHQGWNFDDFDAPYMLDRLELLESDEYDLRPERLSPLDEVWRSYWGPNIKGVVVFDQLEAYKRMVISELDSYRLDAVAEDELGVGKERYAGKLGDLWEDDLLTFVEYNLRDTELCVELDRQTGLMQFWREVATFVGCKLDDAPIPSSAVDMYVLHMSHGRFALPSRGQQDEGEEYEGATVFEPSMGIFENVIALDLASLYPMSMVTINASPETKVDPDEYDGETFHAPNDVHFRKDQEGFIREMVFELLEERQQKKDLRDEHEPGTDEYEKYDRQQGAVKVLMNSLYGVSGWSSFRLYDAEAAAAVTATGRGVIEFTEECVNDQDEEVLYGDTDSVLIELDDDLTREQCIGKGQGFEHYINSRYDEYAIEELNAEEHRFELEFEKLYRRYLQAGKKKRYAGHITWKEGKDVDDVDITGFEYKRSDFSPLTKETQYDVIEQICRQGDLAAVKKLIRQRHERCAKGEYSIDYVGEPCGIGKSLPNYNTDTEAVRAAKYANLLLETSFVSGSKPKVVELESVDPAFLDACEYDEKDPLFDEFVDEQDVIGIEFEDQLPPEFAIDWEAMADRALAKPIGRVLEAVDLTFEEVIDGEEQTGLDQWT